MIRKSCIRSFVDGHGHLVEHISNRLNVKVPECKDLLGPDRCVTQTCICPPNYETPAKVKRKRDKIDMHVQVHD